ncbi:MAG: GntR family transcriptional regulator [Desulfovibrionaceae bacterium]|jgi:GntR family transcriptional regulator|nr:GntR family transcriptional regulator [Desulfovibrionaceae bacterium]
MLKNYRFPPVDRDGFKPIYVQVAEMIAEYARHLGLRPGDALPSENQLLAMLDVSRNSIRQAVDRLVQMNFAVKRQGQGTFLKQSEQSIQQDLDHGFEMTLRELGITITNKLLTRERVVRPPDWTHYFQPINDSDTILIQRAKIARGEFLSLEERILPGSVVARYSEEELNSENICPTLMDRYPDTAVVRIKYRFSTKPLPDELAGEFGQERGALFLARSGEYYNQAQECIMHGRHIFISKLFSVSYMFSRGEHSWSVG